jgi:hypothetical protein
MPDAGKIRWGTGGEPVKKVDDSSRILFSGSRSAAIRLLVIPFLVYLAWVLELFLLAGNNRLLLHPEPYRIVIYTFIGCILTGMIVPVICIHKAFISGAVNMYQIGFRSLQRTLLASSLTVTLGLAAILFFNPYGTDRLAFAGAFILLLPTAIASVMICWVLAGTHLQAFVRGGGAVLSIPVGVVVTSLLFTGITLAQNPSIRQGGTLFWPVCTGLIAALFFFSVRDIYATVIVVTECCVLTGTGTGSPGYLHAMDPVICGSSLLAVCILIGIHWYLSRHYATVRIPA